MDDTKITFDEQTVLIINKNSWWTTTPPPKEKNKPQNQQPKFMNKYGNW